MEQELHQVLMEHPQLELVAVAVVDQQTMVLHPDQEQVELVVLEAVEMELMMILVMLLVDHLTLVVAVVEDQDLIQDLLVKMAVAES